MLENIENIDPAYKDNDAIILASQYGHIEVVKRLMKCIFLIYFLNNLNFFIIYLASKSPF